jgi:hypothetical protein
MSRETTMKPKSGHVRITRRLDCYFLTGVIGTGVLGVGVWWYCAARQALTGAPILLFWWAYSRWALHRDGDSYPTITGTPGLIPLLWWLGIWGLGVGIGGTFLLNAFVPLPREWQPMPHRTIQIWVGFGLAWFVVLATVGDQIERWYKKGKTADDSPLE